MLIVECRNSAAVAMAIERRVFRGATVRAKGKNQIEGYAAVFNQQYDNGYFIETVKPGAFSKVLSRSADVRGLFNHNPDHVIGRTKSGTLRLEQDASGLRFEDDLPETARGAEIYALVNRGDVDGCSFSFIPSRQTWREEVDPQDSKRRILYRDIEEFEEVFDVGPVTFPAYTGTSVSARSAAIPQLWPAGIPAEIRQHVPALRERRDPADGDEGQVEACRCTCRACYSAECNECEMHMATCGDDRACGHTDDGSGHMRTARDDKKKTKRVDGEDLPASSFLYVGDPDKTATWSLPWKFSTADKTKSHLRNALARFEQTKNIPADKKAGVWKKLVAKCKKYGIQVSSEESKAWGLTAEHRAELVEARVAVGSSSDCQCDCEQCQTGDCVNCSEDDCPGEDWGCDHEEKGDGEGGEPTLDSDRARVARSIAALAESDVDTH